MALFAHKAPPVSIGDRFTKAGDRVGKVWQVAKLWTTVDEIPHARLTTVEGSSETLAVSVNALTDLQFFVPTPHPGA